MADWSNKEQVLARVANDGMEFENASDALRSDKEVVLAALQQVADSEEGDCWSLCLVFDAIFDEKVKQDEKVRTLFTAKLVSLFTGETNWEYEIPEDIRTSLDEGTRIEIATIVLSVDGSKLADLQKYLPMCTSPEEATRWRGNKKLVLAAVQNYGLSLEYASEVLWNDVEVVMCAVAQDVDEEEQAFGGPLQFASEVLRKDRRVVEAAIGQNPFALQHASFELRSDRNLVAAAVQQATCDDNDCIGILLHASLKLRSNREFMLEMIEDHMLALQFASKSLKSDANFQKAWEKFWKEGYSSVINLWNNTDEDNEDEDNDDDQDDEDQDEDDQDDEDDEPTAKRRRTGGNENA